ncbi:MAG TPA: hypothetical protein DHV71_04420, partial [Acidaminococcaceae bacterium]|nr:hypothetical protein [Acidaminococcaceae bacterium]
LVAEDSVIGVEGRFSIDEREEKVIASQIVPLQEGQAAPPLGRSGNGRTNGGYGGYAQAGYDTPPGMPAQETASGYGAPSA